jgi:hypothetical protein
MLSEEEIRELIRTHRDLEGRLERFGTAQRPATVRLSKQLKLLMAEIESMQEKEKNTWNPAASTRVRMAKRAVELSKDLVYFERWAGSEFDKGNLSKDVAKRLVLVASLARSGKMQEAKKEFGYFEEIIELNDRHEKAGEELGEGGKELRREKHRMEIVLSEISDLENDSVDQEKVRKHLELMKSLENLRKAREAYLHSLISKPVTDLLAEMEVQSLKDYCPSFPSEEELANLMKFFHDYPSFGRFDVGQLCECFGYSEKKLSHICPETTRFRKLVAGNAVFFEAIRSLGQTGFLAVEGGDAKTLDFYARMGEIERKCVEEIRRLGKERRSYEEEYERSRQHEKRREELSRYSKGELEAELKSVGRLIELLDSGDPNRKIQDSGGNAEKPGLLSIIGSIFGKSQ